MFGTTILRNNFTLLEVLIAASISAIVLGIISAAAWSTLQTVGRTEQRMDVSMQTAALVRRLSQDLRGSRLNVVRSQAERLMILMDEEDPPAFYAVSGRDSLEMEFFTTAAMTGPHMPAGLYRVSYSFRGSAGELKRRQGHIAQVDSEELPWQVVGERIESIGMRFYDGEEWKQEWDSNEEDALPVLIEVTISRLHGETPGNYVFVVSPDIRN